MGETPASTDVERRALRGRSAVVTGATGFIGTRLCAALLEEGAVVRALVRAPFRGRHLRRTGVDVRTARLDRTERLADALRGADLVFHVAHDFGAGVDANVAMAEALADASENAGVRRVVFVSSAAVYDDWPAAPVTEESPSTLEGVPYKRAKRSVERMFADRAAAGRLDGVSLEPTIVYGPGGWMWTGIPARRLVRTGVVLPVEPGLCDLVHVDDVVQGLLLGAREGRAGARYLISGPGGVTWQAYYEALARELDVDPPRYEPLAPLPSSPPSPSANADTSPLASALRGAIGGRASRRIRDGLERMFGGNAGTPWRPGDQELPMYRARGGASIERARRELGYEPMVDLAEGIARSRAYLKKIRHGRGH